jgi:hypothetical protein
MTNGAGLASRPVRCALRGSVRSRSRSPSAEPCSLPYPTVPAVIMESVGLWRVTLS